MIAPIGSPGDGSAADDAPVRICLLGGFRLVKQGKVLPVRRGGKMRGLLSRLAVQEHQHATREALLETLWPGWDLDRASQSLNTLVYATRQLLADALAGRPPLDRTDDGYRLNIAAGIKVDTLRFDTCAKRGDQRYRLGDPTGALQNLEEADRLYHGDLCPGETDLHILIERERLRALYLTTLAHLADHYYEAGEYSVALNYAQRLLLCDPCREDAHRVVMRCYARISQRAQAMHQYRLCREILRQEFNAEPEPATEELFGQLRLGPATI